MPRSSRSAPRLLALVMVLAAVAPIPVLADTTLIEHLGANDPALEGWSTVGGGANVLTGPVLNDLGLGIDAWSVDDGTTAVNSVRFYDFTPSGSQVADADTHGWCRIVRLRVGDTPETPDRAIFTDYSSESTRWRMEFGSDRQGDPIVLLQTGLNGVDDEGTLFTLSGGGDGYHTYELRYDPLLDSADLYIDGTERVSGYAGYPDTSNGPRITFGAGQATAIGHAHFSLARFRTVDPPQPVPSSTRALEIALPLALIACALVAIRQDLSPVGGKA